MPKIGWSWRSSSITDGYRAMSTAQARTHGMLLWIEPSCWPSFVWQTYDYYFDPTAGYFGSKKGSEPLHVQWNPLTDNAKWSLQRRNAKD